MSKTVVESFGEFVYNLSYETLPKEIVEKAKTCMLNGIGIGIACHKTEFARIARETIKAAYQTAGRPDATLGAPFS